MDAQFLDRYGKLNIGGGGTASKRESRGSNQQKGAAMLVERFLSVLSAQSPVDLEPELVATPTAIGRYAAGEIRSSRDLPPFDRAAVDGYGLTVEDLPRPEALWPVAKIPAGRSTEGLMVRPGQCVWLATGAAVPPGVSAIAMEEHATYNEHGQVSITGRLPVVGTNIRKRGEDVVTGQTLLPARTLLEVRHLALLSATGCAEISVHRKLRVVVLSVGDELVDDGPPRSTHTYDSNRPMLCGLLSSPATQVRDGGLHGDDPCALATTLAAAALGADLIVTSGGAAGSQTDKLSEAVGRAGGVAVHHRIALKPGKPVLTGSIGRAKFLGLPGNPFAAYVTARLFAVPLLETLSGRTTPPKSVELAIASGTIAHQRGRTEFAPAIIVSELPDKSRCVVKLGSGGSGSLSPLAYADGLIELPHDVDDIQAGERVAFRPFVSNVLNYRS